MPYKIDETYLFNYGNSDGVQVDELPKSTKVAYNENEGIFEYIIQQTAIIFKCRVRLKFNTAFFQRTNMLTFAIFCLYSQKKKVNRLFFKRIK